MMAGSKLLVLVIFSHLTRCALSFCWKPNINPFMGINQNEWILLTIFDFNNESRVKADHAKVPLIRNGLTYQQCESVGTTSSQRALLVKRSKPKPKSWSSLESSSSWSRTCEHCNIVFHWPPGWLSYQVSPPGRSLQLQTLRPHPQGLVMLII